MSNNIIKSLWSSSHSFIRFGIIGGIGFIIEIVIFNAWVIATQGGPLIANTVSTLIAIFFNWWANRRHNFDKTGKNPFREISEFIVASAAGLIISNVLLWFVFYYLNYTELLIINITKGFGIVLGSIIKYWLYKVWVFKAKK